MPFDEIVNIARVMRHRSIARELSGKVPPIHPPLSLPPLYQSARVAGCNPVEAEIDPALGNRAAPAGGHLCAEKSGTFQCRGPDLCG